MSTALANTLWARTLFDELARSGLREVVLSPGSRSTPLVMAAAADDRLRCRVHLDERSAAFFALGVGKASGRPAAVITTSGTAVANCYPAVVEAAQAGVPLLIISADRPPRLRGSDANQSIDQVGFFGRFPRMSLDLGAPSSDGQELRHLRILTDRAYAASIGADPGPVHLNVPFEKPLEPVESTPSDAPGSGPGTEGRPDGAPFVRVRTAAASVDAARLEAVAELMSVARGVIVAGPSERAMRLGPALRALSAVTGYPLLADPLSGARYGPESGAHIVAAYDLFLGQGAGLEALNPELILRVGASPTSAALQSWIAGCDGTRHMVLDAGGRWKDHGGTASDYLVADPVDTLERLTALFGTRVARTPSDAPEMSEDRDLWRASWRRAEQAAREALAEAARSGPCHEGDIVAEVLGAVPVDGTLFVSSSMPVRDLDAFGLPRAEPLRVYANRGASGIDGVISTAYGVSSQTPGTAVCIIGDVACFHDRNGLLWSREPDAPVVFVVIDNDGGGIFHMLPIAGHEPEFTRLFATPHGVDPSFVAESHGVACVEARPGEVGAEVTRRLAAGSSALIRVRTDRAVNHRRHEEVRATVARHVREALG